MSIHVTEKQALDYHEYPRPGKIEIRPTKPYSTQQDLALAYSPGVAYPCKAIEANAEDVYKYTNKGNLVAVISNGTAVLGLGDIGPEAGKPVMEGKALLFKIYAGLDCFDIELKEKDPKKIIEIVKALAPTFGGINLEDIKAPECFEIETELKKELDIPIMHDDQHGTAIISAAGLLNALEIQKKDISKVKLVVNGAGAAAISCTKLYMALGVRKENIVMCDSKGVLNRKRTDLNQQKKEFVTDRDIDTLAQAMVGADIFLGLSVADVITPEMVLSMADRPIVFALANPNPEISYELAKDTRKDIIMATGRSDYPNQINNVIGFPYIFRGALDCHATCINEAMKLAAVHAIADLAKEPVPSVVNAAYQEENGLKFGPDYILPKPLDPRLLTTVAPAVVRGAMESGVARLQITDWEAYSAQLKSRMGYETKFMHNFQETVRHNPKRVVFGEGNTDNMLRAAEECIRQGLAKPILLGNEEMIEKRAKRLGVDLTGIEIVNLRHDREDERRKRYARHMYEKMQRKGVSWGQAKEKMLDRNYFGMMMVQAGDADAFVGGSYSGYNDQINIAKEVIGIRKPYKHFAGLHILNTQRGIFFLADTLVNKEFDQEAMEDIARLAMNSVSYFNRTPVMAMVSYSNFGSGDSQETQIMHDTVEKLQANYPDLAIEGEMQVHYALNKELRDNTFPFNKIKGKDVNTLIFPSLSAANTALRLMLEIGVGDAIGPIQMGLNRPVHFISVDSPVRDIVNLAIMASIDAMVSDRIRNGECDSIER